MEYSDTVQQSGEYLRMALGYIGTHGIPADPLNYAVWYEYASGKNRDLNTAVENIIERSGTITPEINAELYARYIASPEAIIAAVVQKELQNILERLVLGVTKTEEDLSHSGQRLKTYSRKLDDMLDMKAIRSIAEKIAAEVNALASSSSDLQGRLEEAVRELEKLQVQVEKKQKEAETDCLTGLANRRALEHEMVRAIAHASDTRTDLSLIMADIDHFKKVNDIHGHLVGDNVLRLAAKIINDLIRGNDFSARYGGEEFMVLLPETPVKGALIVAEKIRRYFAASKLVKKRSGRDIGPLTLSLGIAHYEPGDSPETLIERADQALYASKAGGRNRISVDDKSLLALP